MALSEDVSRIAAAAATYAAAGETVAAVLAVETAAGERMYLSAFADATGNQEWLALTDDGAPVTSRERVRADTHAEEERDQREAEDARPPARRERGPDDDVGEVPGGVRRV